MILSIATKNDLLQLNMMYSEIIEDMSVNGLNIWDDIYPMICFESDIENNNLYVLKDNNIIVSAFSLCNTNQGEDYIKWENKLAKSIYLDRLGINVNYKRKGIGTLTLNYALGIAKERGYEYLRLFVVEQNLPALSLYKKSKFTICKGTYTEVIDKNTSFKELGIEIKT